MGLIGTALKTAISSPDALSNMADSLSRRGASHPADGRYDRLIDAANRLPRPALAFGAIAVLLFAMIDPAAFAQRMAALNAAPAELWWILGAVIATHFGAREAHHMRHHSHGQATSLPEKPPPVPSA